MLSHKIRRVISALLISNNAIAFSQIANMNILTIFEEIRGTRKKLSELIKGIDENRAIVLPPDVNGDGLVFFLLKIISLVFI